MLRMARMPSLPLLASTQLSGSDWAQNLLTECAAAISQHDFVRAQHLLWVLNEVSSPYGTYEQRLAYYFMQALFCKMSQTGPRTHLSLYAAAERTNSFDSMRKTMLKFQEASPWVTFGHVAANGAMMEALEGESSVHIIDLSSTFCTQWPTLLEALATRAEGAPSVKLTTVVFNEDSDSAPSMNKVMKEVGVRLEKFARLMGVPFQFSLVQAKELITLVDEEIAERQQHRYVPIDDIVGSSGGAQSTTTQMLAINCIGTLHQIPNMHRQELMYKLQMLRPKIITVVEDMEMYKGNSYEERFGEALRFYALYFEALEGSMGKVSNERGALERSAARRIMQRLGCEVSFEAAYDDDDEDNESKGTQWHEWLQRAGFMPKPFSDDVVDDVRALLKRYKDGWGLIATPGLDDSAPHYSISLTWKDRSVIFATTWTSP
ncbi:hypothetical protein GOP47_0029694 [Adiantum capillus-veneris]|nr:hypothetical protein GOP47_0029694 [Adiantum capillus-veneris]